MRRSNIICTLAFLGLTAAAPHAWAQGLVDGYAWQKSSPVEQRAYLVGLSNSISVGARYDDVAGASNSFSRRAQTGLAGAQLEPTVEAIDAWYRANPSQLGKPVISVIWGQVAKQTAYSR